MNRRTLRQWTTATTTVVVVATLSAGLGPSVSAGTPSSGDSSSSSSSTTGTTTPDTYTVKSGDSLYGIASRTGVPVKTILALNGLTLKSVIHPGQVLKLTGTVPSSSSSSTTTTTTSSSTVTSSSTPTSSGTYTVKSGDSLYGIASKTGTPINTLLSLNGLTLKSVIHPGQVLRISGSAPSTSTTSSTATPGTSTGSKYCPTATAHAAVVDRARQRAWLCNKGQPLAEFVMTSARTQPDPGTYKVYSKSVDAYSYESGTYTSMRYFTAFARGEEKGARVGFHSVPKYRSGAYVQPLSSVGSLSMFGKTAGCIRVLPTQAATIYNWLRYGDVVRVIS